MDIPIKILPILIGLLRQEGANGELALEQNDGVRRLYFRQGELVHLASEVAGEKFGSRLLRQGILDLTTLNGILASQTPSQIGDKVIQSGRMSLQERDTQFLALQEQIMIHALEHPVLSGTWISTPPGQSPAKDQTFQLPYRRFIWNTFQEAHYLTDLLLALEAEADWRWEGPGSLLDSLGDLPLTPGTAYALSFLGTEAVSFETFWSLSDLSMEEAGRLIAVLWALGTLELTGGELPRVASAASMPAAARPPGPAAPPPAPPPTPPVEPDYANMNLEILDYEADREPEPAQAQSIEDHRLLTPEEALSLDLDPLDEPGPPTQATVPPAQGGLARRDPFAKPGPQPPRAPAPPAAPREPAPGPAIELERHAPKPAQGAPGFPQPQPIAQRVDVPVRPEPAQAPIPAREGQPAIELEFRPPQAQGSGHRPEFNPFPDPPKTPARFEEVPPPPPPVFLKGAARARMLVVQARQQALMDRTVEAIRTLEQAVQLGVEADLAYDVWLMLGQLRMANPAWSTRAIDALQHASELRPKAVEPWTSMGELYHRKGFEANAAACYRRVVELNPAFVVPADVDMDAVDGPVAAPPASTKPAVFGKVMRMFGGSRKP